MPRRVGALREDANDHPKDRTGSHPEIWNPSRQHLHCKYGQQAEFQRTDKCARTGVAVAARKKRPSDE